MIAARRLDVLEQAAAELNKESGKTGGKVHVCQCNVRSEEEIQKLVAFALEKMGRIDGLVNNAGGQFVSPVENISARGFKAVVETNLLSCFMLSKECYNQWYGRREGGERGGKAGEEGEGRGRDILKPYFLPPPFLLPLPSPLFAGGVSRKTAAAVAPSSTSSSPTRTASP